jgi:hypothetical protein
MIDDDNAGFSGHLGILAQATMERVSTELNLLSMADKDIDVSQNPRDLQASNLELEGKRNHQRVCEFDEKYPKAWKGWIYHETFYQEK